MILVLSFCSATRLFMFFLILAKSSSLLFSNFRKRSYSSSICRLESISCSCLLHLPISKFKNSICSIYGLTYPSCRCNNSKVSSSKAFLFLRICFSKLLLFSRSDSICFCNSVCLLFSNVISFFICNKSLTPFDISLLQREQWISSCSFIGFKQFGHTKNSYLLISGTPTKSISHFPISTLYWFKSKHNFAIYSSWSNFCSVNNLISFFIRTILFRSSFVASFSSVLCIFTNNNLFFNLARFFSTSFRLSL